VDGTRVINSHNETVRLRGVNTASLEWSSNGEGHILRTVETAIRDWHANHIRLPLSQDRWFGKAPEQTDQGKAYRTLVQQVVDACAGRGCYVILDLHWSDAGEWGQQIGQHVMPDRNSLQFWKSLASAYKNHPAVIFDLYNEPHDVSWDVWLNGGKVAEKASRRTPAREFEAVGMQALLDAVRETGAKNVVLAGGLDWAYDMSGLLKGKLLSDPRGNGVIYANHTYPFKGDTVEKWIAKMEAATSKLPVIVSEFGSDSRGMGGRGEQWVRQVLQAMEDHNWNWTAWDLHPAAGPCLISNWDYAPTTWFGKWVKLALAGALPQYKPSLSPSGATNGAVQPPRGGTGSLGIFESHGDVGQVLHPGSVAYDSTTRTYTVSGSGENMWFGKDAFHFVWKQGSGDLSMAADVAFPEAGEEPHRKACLMIRQSTDPDSPYVDIALHGDGLTSLQFRQAKGAATHEVQANVSAPGRLRLEKRGKYVRMFLGSQGRLPNYSGAAVRIALAEPFLVGIGVCSHNKNVSERVLFSNVELTTPLPPPSDQPVLYSTLETQVISSTDRRVVHVAAGRIEAPNWLKDGTTLIYNSRGRIVRIPAAGGPPELLDTGFATRCNNDHGVSPDGMMLAISDQSQADRKSRIYTLPIGGGTPTLVTPRGPSYWHGWSPDGRTLAFCGERNGEFDVYTIPATGGSETRLTTAPGLDDGPEFSPDGKHMYFNSVRSGRMQIWRMAIDGSAQEQVTSEDFNNWFPHLSPDGRSMVFLSYEKDVIGHPENKDVALRLMSLGTGQTTILAHLFGGQGTINVPCWSPDGRKIAFVSYQLIAPH
jgi:aryl-phospho-beta-D-glucosidase BglC (GH1 family)